jgi:predicted MFS family arabinose efflux permease
MLGLEQVQRMTAAALLTSAGLMAVSAVALVLLVLHERRARQALIPIELLRDRAIGQSDALAACHGAALVALVTLLPIYLHVARGTSPAQTGLFLLPLMIGIGVGSMATGRMVSITGRTMMFPSIGLVVATLALVFLALRAAYLGPQQLVVLLLVTGLSMGTVMGVVQVTVQHAAGPRALGRAAASVQFSRAVGAATGTAVVAAVLFGVLALSDPETARVFGGLIERGQEGLATLPPASQAKIAGQMEAAFRAAFLAIAAFTTTGLVLAWTMPARRI